MSTKYFIGKQQHRIIGQIVASIMAIGMAGRAAHGQTTNAPADSGSLTNVTKLENQTVVGQLDTARNQIVPDLGATVYTVSKTQIESQAGGENALFNQVILRTPGTAQDGLGQLHLRGEHANLQYRINDVLLPEGITGFGQELDTRFVDNLRLITGSLPAQYGFRTAGVVDVHTKSGAFEPGGQLSIYGGSYDWIEPSFALGGAKGSWNYFVDGSFTHNSIGIENPLPTSHPIHDDTDQYKTFIYASKVIDDTSRVSLMGSASYATFQLPNTPGLPAGTSPDGSTPWSNFMTTFNASTNSANLNENQNEQNYYGVVAYQKSADQFNAQVAAFGRFSGTHFTPDPVGDLFFDGVASDVNRTIYSGGLQTDASYELNNKHTLRGGVMLTEEVASANTTTTVFPTDPAGNPTGLTFPIADNSTLHGLFAGIYLQDEWKLTQKFTINYGARFDQFYATFDHENQLSPRINFIYQPWEATTLHAGYSRYFTPPALENLAGTSVVKFDGTSNASEVTTADHAKAERANYFDAGLSQKLAPGLQVGVDAYYKDAKNQLDDGLFGQSLILSQFNYRVGRVYGVEFTGTYVNGGFSSYANVAVSKAQGKDVTSGQFLFGADDLAYIQDHYVFLDHDQRVTGSFGMSYLWKESANSSARFYLDALYGSGLRTDAPGVPNGASVAASYSVNLGAEQVFKVGKKQLLKARLDVINVTDNVYQLRDGGGIGVNAAQYGMRRGFFGSLTYVF